MAVPGVEKEKNPRAKPCMRRHPPGRSRVMRMKKGNEQTGIFCFWFTVLPTEQFVFRQYVLYVYMANFSN